MYKKYFIIRPALSYYFLGGALAILAGCDGGVSYSTPQAAFEAQRNATVAKDWKTVLGTMTPESRDLVVGTMALSACDAAYSDPKFADVLKQYGIKKEQFRVAPHDFTGGNLVDYWKQMKRKRAEIAAAVSDKPRFFADIMQQFERAGLGIEEKNGNYGFVKQNSHAELTDVVIDGETARGTETVKFALQTMHVPVQFKKIGGSWLIDAPNPSAFWDVAAASQNVLKPGPKAAKSPKEEAAIAALTKLGATIKCNDDGEALLVSFTKVRATTNDDSLLSIKDLPTVIVLVLGGTQITDAGLEHLKDLKCVQRILLDGTKVTDAGLKYLKDMTQLQVIDLTSTQVTGAGMADWSKLTEIRELTLAATPFDDAGLFHLQHLSKLDLLNLSGTKITDAGLQYVRGNKNLEHLCLMATGVTDAACAPISSFTHISELNLDSTAITDAGLARLGGLESMQRLDLRDTKIDDTGLAIVNQYPNLNLLDVKGTKVTAEGIEQLKQALPKVKITQ